MLPRIRKATYPLLALLLVTPAGVTSAAGSAETVKWYDVEMIVFRHVDPRSNETWPLDKGLPDVEGLPALFPGNNPSVSTAALGRADSRIPAGAPQPFTPLPEDMLTLRNHRDALGRSSRYRPLLHVGWTQPPLERENSPKLRISLPGALDPRELEENQPERINSFGDEFAESSPAGRQLVEANSSPRFARPLDGFVQIGVGLYLHVNIDLLYLPEDVNPDVVGAALPDDDTMDDSETRSDRRRAIMEALARGDLTLEEADILMLEPEEQVFHGFRLDTMRRVRSGELHYFDHPVFGILLKVTPREIPVSAALRSN